jgi:hypothetical protein
VKFESELYLDQFPQIADSRTLRRFLF